MTEHYVTLFDSVFLPQGLALHHSLLEHGGDFLLWVLCLDDDCFNTLRRLDLPQMRLLDLASLETPELLAVKPCRSRAEYCWTLTPWSIEWVLEADHSAQRATYLDADVYFLKSPAPVFAEFEHSGCAVLITEHGYAPEYDQTPTSGRYCVQFLTVVRRAGEHVLHWWRDRCLEWCFARFENGLFGDQKYLERFETEFPGLIYSVGPDPRFQGPWNAGIFPFSKAIIYHFHSLRIHSSYLIYLTDYVIPRPTLTNVYLTYCSLLLELSAKYNLLVHSQASGPIRLRFLKHIMVNWVRRRLIPESGLICWFHLRAKEGQRSLW